MRILNNIKVPTGNILIIEGDLGKLECLSIGDYGKEKNIKADFLGLPDDINGVPHGELLSLSKKWVITISTQYGCASNCTFCDVPKVGSGKNATLYDMKNQIEHCLSLHKEVVSTERLNIHFARMGEPTWNKNVLKCAEWLYYARNDTHRVHPVVSTMMPRKNKYLGIFLMEWIKLKNELYKGNAGLQLSINSTDEEERSKMFSGNALSINEIGVMMNGIVPKGRKITLNFALSDYTIDEKILLENFPPEYYICKLTPMHETSACKDSKLLTENGYTDFKPYKETEEKLKSVGYDVIVFVPSKEEDESKITCGNAILSHIKSYNYPFC